MSTFQKVSSGRKASAAKGHFRPMRPAYPSRQKSPTGFYTTSIGRTDKSRGDHCSAGTANRWRLPRCHGRSRLALSSPYQNDHAGHGYAGHDHGGPAKMGTHYGPASFRDVGGHDGRHDVALRGAHDSRVCYREPGETGRGLAVHSGYDLYFGIP